ncbi:MAG: NB-ARC domain-containing protein, partial [Myxococcota bacterium]
MVYTLQTAGRVRGLSPLFLWVILLIGPNIPNALADDVPGIFDDNEQQQNRWQQELSASVVTMAKQIKTASAEGNVPAIEYSLRRLHMLKQTPLQSSDALAATKQLLQVLADRQNQWLGVDIKTRIAQQVRHFINELLPHASVHIKHLPSADLRQLQALQHQASKNIDETDEPACELKAEIVYIGHNLYSLNHEAANPEQRLHEFAILPRWILTGKKGYPTTFGRLYAYASQGEYLDWYSVVLTMEFLQHRATQDPQALKQLQLIIHKHWQALWPIGYASINALAHVVFNATSFDLAWQAYYGDKKSDKKGPKKTRLPGLQDCLRLQKSFLRDNWRVRVVTVKRLQQLTKHHHSRIAYSARKTLESLLAREENGHVHFATRHPSTAAGQLQGAPSSIDSHTLPTLDTTKLVERPQLTWEIYKRLHAKTPPNMHERVTRTLVLHGMSGVGKTTLALIHAHRNLQHLYNRVWWIQADSHKNFINGVRNTAHRMGLHNANIENESHVLQYIHQQLSNHPGWLLVLDNINNPQWLHNQQTGKISLYPPRGGHVLITSQLDHWPSAQMLNIDVFTPKQAEDCLKLYHHPANEQQHQAMQQLAEQHLGNLPLALTEAGAYLKKHKHNFTSYLQLYAQHGYALHQSDQSSTPHSHRTVIAALSQNLDKIEKEHPQAA